MLANKASLTIVSENIQSIKAKFDELEAFISRVNTSSPISLICLQECSLDEKNIESTGMFNLKDCNMSYQTTSKQCCGNGGLIIYTSTLLLAQEVKQPQDGIICVLNYHTRLHIPRNI